MPREKELTEARRNPWRTIKAGRVVRAPMPPPPTAPKPPRTHKKAQKPKPKHPHKLKYPVGTSYLKDFFKGKTVAVVGNSFDKEDIADQVDNHDIVVRFNLDPARLRYGYTQVRPQVPAGDKTTVMAAFWNRMNVPGIVRDFPDIELLVSLRPDRSRMHANYVRAQLYDINKPVFMITPNMYHGVSRKVNPPVLCGMVFMHILLQVNTARCVDFYNFNFYVPSLNSHVDDVRTVYKKYLFGKKGNRCYGNRKFRKGHNLSKSYRWFKKMVERTPNFIWRVSEENKKKIEEYLL